jgi:hypothetical protein
MVSRDEALRLVQAELPDWEDQTTGDRLLLLPDMTEETPYAWVVHYTNKLWYETQDVRYMRVGGGPDIVSKQTGSITHYGSAHSTESALQHYEEEQQLYGLRVTADLTQMPVKLLVKSLLGLTNQELLQLVREPATWVARGARLRLKKLRLHLLQKGLPTEVQPCF